MGMQILFWSTTGVQGFISGRPSSPLIQHPKSKVASAPEETKYFRRFIDFLRKLLVFRMDSVC